MKKGLKLFGIVALSALAMTSCGEKTGGTGEKIKVGLIALHDTNSTYDNNFIKAFKAAAEKTGVEASIKINIPEGEEAYNAATAFVDDGCKFVFADSFGHESYILRAAKENADVEFGHGSGYMAHNEKKVNFSNAFASIYEGRYLAGVAAGLKLQAMMAVNSALVPTVGYVGAYPYAEVKSGYTSWFLGVRSIVSNATMKVRFTGSWYDEAAEKNAATKLINDDKCILISQHADSMGAPTACENAKVPDVTYNGSTEASCPDTYVISSKINWEPYFETAFNAVKAGKHVTEAIGGYDYIGGIGEDLFDDSDKAGSVALSKPGKKAAVADTEAKLKEVADKIRNHSLRVFDTANFTVKGAHLDSYLADVDGDYKGETDVIKTDSATGIKYFAESELRSAPYFDVDIDGITLLTD